MSIYKPRLDLRGHCSGWYREYDVFLDIMDDRMIADPELFLHPAETNLLPLDSLPNIHEAYKAFVNAVNHKRHIAIFADVDCDGITSAAIMYRYAKDLGIIPSIYINESKIHGLDPSQPYWENLKEQDLLIIVDSLDSDTRHYEELHHCGVKIIILDHHNVDTNIPYGRYATLVTSQVGYKNSELSGAGVAWKFCSYVDEMENTDYASAYMDLCACGLLADVMSMKALENRYLVYSGLRHLYNPGIKKIIGRYEFNSTSVLFSIAPLINASTRMDQAKTALHTFLYDDSRKIDTCIRVMQENKKWQDMEVQSIMWNIIPQCDLQADRNLISAVIQSDYGIAGLVATKISSQYGKPAIILKDCGNVYKGSLRSDGIDLMAMVNESGYGKAMGHEQAAGVEIAKSNYNKLLQYLEEHLENIDKNIEKEADALLELSDLSVEFVKLIREIDYVSGKDFKPVKFMFEGIDDYEVGTLKNGKHLVIKPTGYPHIDIIKWNSTYDLQEFEDAEIIGIPITAVGTIDMSVFRNTVKLQIICDEILLGE